MNTTTQPTHTSTDQPSTHPGTWTWSGAGQMVRRIWALGRMETRWLARNKTALVNAVLAPPVLVLVLLPLVGDLGAAGEAIGAQVLTLITAFGLLFIAYYNLTTTAVARREELTLKRLTSGQISHGEVLAGMATPGMLIVLAQVVLAAVVVALGLSMPLPVNPLLVVVALIGGFVVFALLGYASSGLTKTVESAQLTTLPVIFIAMLASGVGFPLENLPEVGQQIAALTPLAPVVTLMQMGMIGVGPDGQVLDFAGTLAPAAMPVLVLVGWCVLGVLLTRRSMRWEPRR